MEAKQHAIRRRVPRRSLYRRVGLLINGQYHVNQTLQVGEGGMRLRSSVPLEEGKRLVVAFHLPDLGHIVCRAIVRYVIKDDKDGLSFGLQFETIDFDSKRQIRNYVASKSKDEFEGTVAATVTEY